MVETGLPEHVTGWTEENAFQPDASLPWSRYWGTLSPVTVHFLACDAQGEVKFQKSVQHGYEVLEYETGAITRQILDNDDAYSMPSFERYHVRDRESWEFYKRRMTPSAPWSEDRIREACEPYLQRERPLCFNLGSTWGFLRDLMGVEVACMIIYDDPELARDIIDWHRTISRTYQFPLVEYLRPEIVLLHEDCCYNNGMMISPQHFLEFCRDAYYEVARLKESLGIEMFAVDSDGDVRQFIPLLVQLGANALYPLEAKSNPDLLALREANPDFILMGGLEKEVINEGNESMIEQEIASKVPPLLERGRYFPNIDHTLQPMCTFDNVCRFMTRLHEVLGDSEGTFPRIA